MYYFFAYKKQPGCPSYLGTLLHDSQQAALEERPMLYSWVYPAHGEQVTELPEEIWMLSKSKKYDFDIKSDFNGFIISDYFLSIMENCNIGTWEKSKINIILKDSSAMPGKKYWYMRQQNKDKQTPSEIVDIKNSNIYLRKDGTVRQMKSLKIMDTNTLDLFMLNDSYEYLFCSQVFADASQNLKGCQLLPVTNLKPDNLELI